MKKKKIIIAVISLLIIIQIIYICSKKTIIGKWKAIDVKDEYYYIFNKDKTCSYEMKVARLDCTYKIDENKISILYKGNKKTNTFEYQFDKEYLIIEDENHNKKKFIKQKEEKSKKN
jgi:hypothetical protein